MYILVFIVLTFVFNLSSIIMLMQILDELKKISIRKIKKSTKCSQNDINNMINKCKEEISNMCPNSKIHFLFNRSVDYNGGYFPFTNCLTTTTLWLRDLLIAPPHSTCFDE
ncbi:hypothetical protein [Lacrimispora sp. 38-1]|uniref:hypothetical protein n=1 Tax=Lacrimispora sp. 38-1 TaxID=3125778 RepID=UPI003CF6B8D3